MNFEWDESKARINRRKHGVRFEDACSLFDDPFAIIFDDQDHSLVEQREIIIGTNSAYRLQVVCFVQRGDTVRLISARSATSQERKDYENNV